MWSHADEICGITSRRKRRRKRRGLSARAFSVRTREDLCIPGPGDYSLPSSLPRNTLLPFRLPISAVAAFSRSRSYPFEDCSLLPGGFMKSRANPDAQFFCPDIFQHTEHACFRRLAPLPSPDKWNIGARSTCSRRASVPECNKARIPKSERTNERGKIADSGRWSDPCLANIVVDSSRVRVSSCQVNNSKVARGSIP